MSQSSTKSSGEHSALVHFAKTVDQMHEQIAPNLNWPVTLQSLAEAYYNDLNNCDMAISDALACNDQNKVLRLTSFRLRIHMSRLARVATHMAIRNQVQMFTLPGLDEETHTAAFYGALASYVLLVNGLAPHVDPASRRQSAHGLYWVHQNKLTEEPRTGADFGVMTEIDATTVKLTLFQAKRPSNPERFDEIDYRHTVRSGKPSPSCNERYAYAQLKALDHIIGKIVSGSTLERILSETLPRILSAALNDGSEALFQAPYSYDQSTAFLATALRGLQKKKTVENLFPKQTPGIRGWCHYVQWPYADRQEPWTATITEVLKDNGVRRERSDEKLLSTLLSYALSPTDCEVGLLVDRSDVAGVVKTISSLLPGLIWGFVSNSEDAAIELSLLANLEGQGAQAQVRGLVKPNASPRTMPTQIKGRRRSQDPEDTNEGRFKR